MLKNNIEIDVKVKCVEEQMIQAELAEKPQLRLRMSAGSLKATIKPQHNLCPDA